MITRGKTFQNGFVGFRWRSKAEKNNIKTILGKFFPDHLSDPAHLAPPVHADAQTGQATQESQEAQRNQPGQPDGSADVSAAVTRKVMQLLAEMPG